MNKVELLAPAGNFESLMAAIQAGADAVYLGIGELNMRATANLNFEMRDLKNISELCHKNNIKVYVTLNTVVYDEEIGEIKKIIDEIKKQKIDAIIASDLAVINYARAIGVEVHISTQMSVSNLETVKFVSQFADRVVLARELSLEQITKIIKEIEFQKICGPNGKLIEIEVFAHGAMCVGVSGRCQMSLFHYNSSANKGRCVQMCRRKYRVIDVDTEKELVLDNNLIMSRSDLCTLDFLDKLVESGVKVLKIEGRGRGADYVYKVIKVYKKALEDIENKNYSKEKIEGYLEELKTVFNRGFSQGFYLGRSVDEWAKGEDNLATEKKQLIGQVNHFYPKPSVVEFKINSGVKAKNGDNFIITGPVTGIVLGTIEGILFDDNIVTFKIDKKVKKNDKVFLIYPV
ncbi:MAG: peptidase U32 family protein [Candidatus Shapirobacteria bacterium]